MGSAGVAAPLVGAAGAKGAGRARPTFVGGATMLLVVVVAALMTVLGTVALWFAVPEAMGWRPVTVTSGSMMPHIRAGDLVMYDPSARDAPPGAIIVFRDPGGRGLLTHRVVSSDLRGGLSTRGDANPTIDDLPVPRSMVLGRVRLVIPMVGGLLRSPLIALAVIGWPCMLLLLVSRVLRRGPPRQRPRTERRRRQRRRRRVMLRGSLTPALVVVVLATSVFTAYSVSTATTVNTANAFSTLFAPSSVPAALTSSLATVGAVQVAVIAGDTLYIGGDFTAIEGTTRNRLAAIDLTTDTLTAWNPNVASTVNAIAVDVANNVVYAGGAFVTVNGGTTRNRLAAFDASTGTATGWNPNSGGTVQALALDSANDVVYTGGSFTTINGATARNRLAGISTITGTATSWDPNVGNNNAYTLALDSANGVVYAGGDFTLINGATTRNRLAAISTATAAVTSWDPNASNIVYQISLDSANGLLYTGGTFTSVGGQTRNRVAAIATDTAQATAWDPNSNNTVREVAFDAAAGLLYVGGDFTSIAGSTRNRIAAISVATTTPAPWNPNLDAGLSALALDPTNDRVAFGGSFTSIDVTDRAAIAATARASTTDADLPSSTAIDVGTTGAIRAVLRAGSTLYIGGDFTWVNGSSRKHLAAIDTTTGTLTAWNPTTDQTVRAFALDSTNGVLYVGGDFSNAGGSLRQHLAAFSTSTGNLSAWWSPTNGAVNALAVDPAAGMLYAGGAFTNAGWQTRNRLAAISTTTGAASSFDANLNNTANALALDTASGTLYAGGTFTTVNGATTRNRIAALSTATGTATSWDANLNNTANAFALDTASGTLYAGGTFTTVNGATTRNRIVALSTSTAIATSWNANANNIVYTLALDGTNSALYAAGSFTTVNGSTTRNRLAALSTVTATATAWNPNVGATNVFALAVNTGTGTAYLGGDFPTVGGATREALASVTGGPGGTASVGSLSITSASNLGAIYATARDGNTLYIGGTFTYVAGQARNRLAAIDLTTDTVTAWNPNLSTTVRALVVDAANGLVYAGGDFTTVNGSTTRNRLAALSTTTGTATAWNPNINNVVRALALDTTNALLYAGGDFTTVNGATTRNRLTALSTTTATATAWNPNMNNVVYALAFDVTNGLIYVSGSFTTVNGGATRNRLAAIATSTGTASAWDPNANNITASLALDTTNGLLYAGGDFTTVNGGTTRNRLAALSTTTATATSWNPNVASTVNALAIDAGNGFVYATGAFTTVGGLARNRIAAVSSNTGLPTDWNPNLNNTGRALALTGSQVIAGGDFNLSGPRERGGWVNLGLAPANQPLSYETGVRAVTGATAANVYAAAIAGTTLYIGGDFTAATGVPRRRLAAFDLTTNALTAWNPSADALVRAIVVDSTNNVLYAGGDFLLVNNATTRNRIAAVSTTTGTATSFDPNSNGIVRALAFDATNGVLYAGGDFTTVNGATTRNRLAALATTTAVATTFDPNMANPVYALALDETNSTIYAGGTFTTVNGATTRNRIAALATASGTASAWDGNANNTVRTLALDTANGLVYAGGDFTTVNGATTRNRVAALSTTNAAATSWNANSNNIVYAVVLDAGAGVLYATGTFTTVNGGTTRNRAASLSTTTATATSWNPNLNSSGWALAVSVPIKRVALGGAFTTAGGQARAGITTYGG